MLDNYSFTKAKIRKANSQGLVFILAGVKQISLVLGNIKLF